MIQLRRGLTLALLLSVPLIPLQAQHEGHDMPKPTSMSGTLGISMDRMGSGTTWVPEAVPLPSRHYMLGDWMVMLHGWAFLQYDWQDGPRGGKQFGSNNWAMVMADGPLLGGRAGVRFMPSLEPWTVGSCGYPLLLQTGESCNDGRRIVDKQHPHDFFMELAAQYELALSDRLALLVYAAPAGEPALGPVAFMHRPSAMDEPQAPLGHHFQDATHTSFGVATAGVFTRKLRIEASAFNGREPNEFRWGIEAPRFTSRSGRVTINPSANLSLTAGYGRIVGHERIAPNVSLRRLVLSALHGRRLAKGHVATTLIYGMNAHEGGTAAHSALAESQAVIGRNTLFGRVERVQRTTFELQLPGAPIDHEHHSAEPPINVTALSLGFVRELLEGAALTLGLGVRGSLHVLPENLEGPYGSRMPFGGMVFLRLRPAN